MQEIDVVIQADQNCEDVTRQERVHDTSITVDAQQDDDAQSSAPTYSTERIKQSPFQYGVLTGVEGGMGEDNSCQHQQRQDPRERHYRLHHRRDRQFNLLTLINK
jgi:hypothetical protein